MKKSNEIAIFSKAKDGWAAVPNELTRDKSIPYRARFLYTLINSFANSGSGQNMTWRGKESLAEFMGVNSGTVSRTSKLLKDGGWITTVQRGAMKTSIIIIHAFKGQKISNKEKAKYKKIVDKNVDKWKGKK